MAIKFLISTQRSGSHFLKSLLVHGFDGVECTGEVLRDQSALADKYPALPSHPETLYFWPWYAEKVARAEISAMPDARVPAFFIYLSEMAEKIAPRDLIVDVKYNSIRSLSGYWDSECGSKDFIDTVVLGDYSLLHLTRKNTLRTVVSNKLAQETGIWHRLTERCQGEALPKMAFKPKELLAELRYQTRVSDDYAARLVRCGRRDEVVYEGLVAEVENAAIGANLETIARFVGAPVPSPAQFANNSFKKTTPQNLAEVVENWEEVRAMLMRTEMGWMTVN